MTLNDAYLWCVGCYLVVKTLHCLVGGTVYFLSDFHMVFLGGKYFYLRLNNYREYSLWRKNGEFLISL